jgi:hypothetical protein
MSQTVTERAAEHICDSVHQGSCATGAIADAIEDGLGVARRAVQRSCDAAGEFQDDTTQRLKRHLSLTVMATFATGVAAGTLIALMIKRR